MTEIAEVCRPIMAKWRERSLERALEREKRKSTEQSSRFVTAARELAEDTGSLDFTVQQVVDRAGVSLRSFYRNFAGKDELCLALFEEMTEETCEEIGKRLAGLDEPIERLAAVVRRLYVAERGGKLAGSISRQVHELAANRPEDLRASQQPVVDLLEAEIERAIDRGVAEPGDARKQAVSLLILITGHNQWRSDGVMGGSWPVIRFEDLWSTCRNLLGIRA
jgi:AcrR family transcriptional regulator